MDIDRYNSLEPKPFFYWFRKISDIPRETGNEEAIVEFLQEFAKERSISYETDEYGNTLFRINAAEGYEKEPPMLFQAHLDMVCNKDPGVEFDFSKEPIRFKFDGNDIMGDGTTLGADNGTGVAFMLAVADDCKLHNIPLEMLFTVHEEEGLRGIRHYDCSRIRSRRMVNFDSGYSNVMCVCSAGSIKAEIKAEYDTVECIHGSDYTLTLSGGTGGHGGIMIGKGRMCAINSMGDILNGISKECDFRLCSIKNLGLPGNISAAIECRINSKCGDIYKYADKYWQLVRQQYSATDPDLKFSITKNNDFLSCIKKGDTRSVIDAMMDFRTGVRRLNHEKPDVIISSASCMNVSLVNGCFTLLYGIRSADNNERVFLGSQAERIAAVLKMKYSVLDEYAGWKYVKNSAMQRKLQDCYKKITGKDIDFEFVHGGIEVGPIVGQIPDMDAVGYSPTGIYAHTTKERLVTGEVPVFWDIMLEMMK